MKTKYEQILEEVSCWKTITELEIDWNFEGEAGVNSKALKVM